MDPASLDLLRLAASDGSTVVRCLLGSFHVTSFRPQEANGDCDSAGQAG